MQIERNPTTTARTAFIWIGAAVFLFLLWRASDVVFLTFGGLIAASIFHGLAKLFDRVLPWPFWASLTAAILLLVGLLLAGIGLAGTALFLEFGDLVQLLRQQAAALLEALAKFDIPGLPDVEGKSGPGMLAQMMPDSGGLIGQANMAISTTLGGLGSLLALVVIGVFIAVDPHVYRRGIVSLVPAESREAVDGAILEAAERLGLWLTAQGLSMLTIFFATWAALWFAGTPLPMVLALVAGLLTFVQTIGPVIAGLVILAVGLTTDLQTALIGNALYAVILAIESNVTTPLLQKRFTFIQPALLLVSQLLFGALFGLMGVLFAVPMVATLLPFVERLYIEDGLGGWYRGRADGDDAETR